MEQIKTDEVKALNVVLKADVQGSVEVLRETLGKLSTEEVEIDVSHASVGAISANDILLASASQAVVIGFNVRPDRGAKELADRERVDVRLYTVIYDLIDDMQKAMSGLLTPTFKEEELGHAEVREVFQVTKVGTVAGCMVTDGGRRATPRSGCCATTWWCRRASCPRLHRFKDDVRRGQARLRVRHGARALPGHQGRRRHRGLPVGRGRAGGVGVGPVETGMRDKGLPVAVRHLLAEPAPDLAGSCRSGGCGVA